MNDENSSLPSFPSFLPLSFLITNKFCTEYLERGTAMVIFELSQIEIRPISANEANCCNESNSYICMYVCIRVHTYPPTSLLVSLARDLNTRLIRKLSMFRPEISLKCHIRSVQRDDENRNFRMTKLRRFSSPRSRMIEKFRRNFVEIARKHLPETLARIARNIV